MTTVFQRAALALAEAGYAVIPVATGTKNQPLVRWAEYQTERPTLEQVREWWATWPDANIALIPGPSGVNVLDLDPRNGAITADFASLPTACAHTPSGGVHKFFLADTGPAETVNGLAPGVDVKGNRGYVLFAPSIRDDGMRWAMAPTDLERVLTRDLLPWSAAVPVLLAKMREHASGANGKAEQWVAETLREGAAPGTRNETLVRLSGYLANRVPLDVAKAMLWGWLRYTCEWNEGDWTEQQTHEAVERIYKRAEANQPTIVHVGGQKTADEHTDRVKLAFATAQERANTALPEVEWVVPGWIARGALHDLHGLLKSGKSTLVAFMVKALTGGGAFAGTAVPPSPVIWLTEQPRSTFDPLLASAEILEAPDLHLLAYGDVLGTPWDYVVKAAVERALTVQARLIVVDTFSKWAGLRRDAENSAGEVLAALDPLQVALKAGVACLLVTHDRKSGGDVVSGGRGSNALAGEVDVLFQLVRKAGQPDAHVHYEGRLGEIPDLQVLRLGDEGFELVNVDEVRQAQQAKRRARQERKALAVVAAWLTNEWQTITQIASAAGKDPHTVRDKLKYIRDLEDYSEAPPGFLETSAPRAQHNAQDTPLRWRRAVTRFRFIRSRGA